MNGICDYIGSKSQKMGGTSSGNIEEVALKFQQPKCEGVGILI